MKKVLFWYPWIINSNRVKCETNYVTIRLMRPNSPTAYSDIGGCSICIYIWTRQSTEPEWIQNILLFAHLPFKHNKLPYDFKFISYIYQLGLFDWLLNVVFGFLRFPIVFKANKLVLLIKASENLSCLFV